MPKQIALLLFGLFILWLFAQGRKACPMTSKALWVPLLWVMIIGSRPVSAWFNAGVNVESPVDYLDGSPFDRNVFLALIVAGFVILLARRVRWGSIIASNRWVFLFIVYCGISAVWSDYPFASFKRWIKELGNIVMVLIILTEVAPAKALKAVFARYTYAAIPLSVLFIKYYPDIGRYYNFIDRWTWEPAYCGVATQKNGLGCILLVCGMFLLWDFFGPRAEGARKPGISYLAGRVILAVMVVALAVTVHSATSAVCLMLGAGIFFLMRLPLAKRQVRHAGVYGLLLAFAIYVFPDVLEASVGMVGRNMTLTGRTELWTDLLNMSVNPVVGAGYQSFWLASRIGELWEKYPFHPLQAHNGYLETYLNGGLVGLSMLMALIISTGGKLKRAIIAGSSEAVFLFSFFVAILLYNWTEAMFYGLSLVWIMLLIAAMGYPRLTGPQSPAAHNGFANG